MSLPGAEFGSPRPMRGSGGLWAGKGPGSRLRLRIGDRVPAESGSEAAGGGSGYRSRPAEDRPRGLCGGCGVRWIDRDRAIPVGGGLNRHPLMAGCTATLHWLEESVLSRVYCDVAGLLRPGGVLVNADHMPLRSEVLSGAGSRLYAERFEPAADREDWDGWWEAISRKAGLADALEKRERRFGRRRTHEFMPRSRGMYSISPVQAPLRRSFGGPLMKRSSPQ